MKFLALFAIIGFIAADVYVKTDASVSPIIKSLYESHPDGNSFNYTYEIGNSIVAQAAGVVKNPNSDTPTLEVKGTVSYVSPEGIPVELTYFADEGGFQASSSLIPVALGNSEMIFRNLKYIAEHLPPVERLTIKKN